MKVRVLDILACPNDNHWPLKYHVFEDVEIKDIALPKADEITKVVCKYHCAKKGITLLDNESNKITKDAEKVNYSKDCKECFSREIVAGIISCPKCKNYYPVIEEIPLMVKEDLRNQDIEREFTTKWSGKIKELIK